jgi:hypothetical protein
MCLDSDTADSCASTQIQQIHVPRLRYSRFMCLDSDTADSCAWFEYISYDIYVWLLCMVHAGVHAKQAHSAHLKRYSRVGAAPLESRRNVFDSDLHGQSGQLQVAFFDVLRGEAVH